MVASDATGRSTDVEHRARDPTRGRTLRKKDATWHLGFLQVTYIAWMVAFHASKVVEPRPIGVSIREGGRARSAPPPERENYSAAE